MAWEQVGLLTLSSTWQYTDPIAGDLVRLRHITQPYGRGLICQAAIEGENSALYDIKRIYPKVEPEIFNLVPPWGIDNRRIALKQSAEYAPPWQIAIDRYVEGDSGERLVRYADLAAIVAGGGASSDFTEALAAKADLAAMTAALAGKADTITLTAQTVDATLTEMVTPQRVLIHANATAGYEMQLVGHSMGTTPEFIYWLGSGAVYRGAAASSTMLQTATGTRRSSLGNGSNWNPTITADTVNGGLKIQVKGDLAKTVKWVASIQLTEVW